MNDRLTRSDIEKMEEELQHRKLVVRPELIDAVKTARAFGDLSENFEYHAARREKARNDSRITYLENMIRTAIIIEDESAEDEVGLNKKVKIVFDDEEDEEEFKIVTAIRGDSLRGLITPESPLGAALMGHKVGDRVEVNVEAGSYFVTITAIENTGEEETDVIRSY